MLRVRIMWFLLWASVTLLTAIPYMELRHGIVLGVLALLFAIDHKGLFIGFDIRNRRTSGPLFNIIAVLSALACWILYVVFMAEPWFRNFWLPTLLACIGLTGQVILSFVGRRSAPRSGR